MSDPDAQAAQKPAGALPGERQTRLSAVWTALAVAVVALLAILVFILQNANTVAISFLVFHGRLPLAVALLFAMILGAVIVMAIGAARIFQLRGVARRARNRRSGSNPPLESPQG